MVSIDKLQKGIANYLDAELMPSFEEGGYKKIIIGTVLGLYLNRMNQMILQYSKHPAIKILNIVDDNNNIDIDIIRDELKKQIPQEGFKIDAPMVGIITFTKEDIDVLYNYITK